MKKLLFVVAAACLLVCTAGFSLQPASSTSKQFRTLKVTKNGPTWISCNRGYLHSCDYVEHYYLVDAEPGDTYHWRWMHNTWGAPVTDLGTGTYVDVQLSEGDVLFVTVNSETYGEYEYWDTAGPCEQ